MTITYGPLQIECDCCGDVVEAADVDCKDFYELKDAVEEDGWRTRRIDKRWKHFCCDCVKNGADV